MATFQRRGTKWRVQVRKGGKYQQQTFDKKADGEVWARDVERSIDRNEYVEPGLADSLTLGEALERYGQTVTPTKKSAEQEMARVKQWRRHPLAARPLGKLTAADIAKYRDDRRASGTSPTTIRTDLALVAHLFTIAQKEWMLPVQNPVRAIRLPAPARARDRRFEGDEEEKLLSACRAYPDQNGKAVTTTVWLEPAVRLALSTAMRMGELLSLRWSDVDWLNRTAFLRETKNGDVRRVPLSREAIVALLAVPIRGDDERVLPTSRMALQQAYRHAAARAGVVGLRFHDLRHEATSRLFERSTLRDIEIAAITGHRTHAMLQRYANLRAGDLAKLLD